MPSWRTTHSETPSTSSSQSSPSRASRPATTWPPSSRTRRSGPSEACSREARLTREYSATVRSATSASRSTQVEPVGLLLEVVEHGEHRLFPAHDHVHCPDARDSKRPVDKRLTPDDSERCLMQTQANARIWHDGISTSSWSPAPRWALAARARSGRAWSLVAAVVEVVSDGPCWPSPPARLPAPAPPGAAGRPRRGAGQRRSLAAGPVAAAPAPFEQAAAGPGPHAARARPAAGAGARRAAPASRGATRATASGGSRSSTLPRGVDTRRRPDSCGAPTAPTAA